MIADLKPYPAMKDSGVPWLGEVPGHCELLPHAADAWFDPTSVKIGYEISFTRYFYLPQPPRTLEEIRADILAPEKETGGLLNEIVGSER